jgi:hypothetical protein
MRLSISTTPGNVDEIARRASNASFMARRSPFERSTCEMDPTRGKSELIEVLLQRRTG